MTKSPSAVRARPRILYSQTPHSISRRAKSLPRTAGELLRHLCELTIGFGKGSVDLPYRALAEALGKDWSTVARAAMLLKKSGDVVTEPLRDGSYRWSVVLEPGDVVSDPLGIYRVRTVSDADASPPPHGENAIPPMAKTPWGHGENAIPPMAKTPWGHGVVDNVASPCTGPLGDVSEEGEKEPLKITLKDTCSKIHQQKADESAEGMGSDDESFDHKNLLGELIALGTGQRMARKLLREHEHQLVRDVLERVRKRTDLENRAGYLIREIEDGGYEAPTAVKPSIDVSRETTSPPLSGYERTRAEQAALEADSDLREALYRQEIQALLQRFKGLPESFQSKLKVRWKHHLEIVVPNVARKAELMEEKRFQKIAFRDVVTSFFALVDQGLSSEQALARLERIEEAA